MTPAARIGGGAIAAVVLGWVGWSVANGVYLERRAELRASIDETTARVDGYTEALARLPQLDDRLQAFVDRTLGGDEETVDHRLRTRLNRIAETIGLADTTVGTGAASPRRSPARNAFPRGGAWRAMRDEIDVYELDAWVSGRATWESVVQLVDRLEAEPWLKRLDHVKIDPKDNGDEYAVTVRLTTLYLPGRAPDVVSQSEYETERLARYEGLVQASPFRLPAPEAPVVAHAPPPAPPRFPWNHWWLTGVAQGPGGPEAWVRHDTSGEARRLEVGDTIDAATLVAAAGEWAEFRLGEGRFRVRVGGNLNDRSLVTE
jgi:hypothetical protein